MGDYKLSSQFIKGTTRGGNGKKQEGTRKNKLEIGAMSTQDIVHRAFNGEPRFYVGDTKKAVENAISGAQTGHKEVRAESLFEVEYGLREYAEANMPEWIQAGEELIYPEKLDSWKKRLESTAKGKVHGFDITNAIEIMRILDSDVDVKDVVEKYRTKRAYGSYVTHLVLEFSKKGPEYLEQFMSVAGVELTPQMREKLEALKAENRQYAENELATNRKTKADKTEELARASSQLDELATENAGKDKNQAVQE